MSGVAGVFNRDGRPADPRVVGRMLNSMRHRGPDGQASFVSGPVALGCARLCSTEESLLEHQPLCDESTQLALVFDGRVDNRAELKDALVAAGMPPQDDTDAELVLRAYQCWGDESPARILGDFAYVICDGVRERIFCARDPLGMKPLYYYLDAKRFVCASELQAILLEPEAWTEPNEGMAAELMCGRVLDPEETLFRGIAQVVPGDYLAIDSERVRKRRYWAASSAREIRYSTDREYASHFFDLLREAVRCRLRHPGNGVAAQLSGGLDSSSVVSMAAHLKREGAGDAAPFETFSLISPAPKDDERRYIDEVVRKWQLRSTLLGPGPFSVANAIEQTRRFSDIADFPNDTAITSLYRDIRDKQYRVMLTGMGGDELFWGRPEYYADAVRGLRVGSIVRRYRDDRRVKALNPDTFSPSKKLLRFGIAPMLPRSVRRAASSLRETSYPCWLEADFVRRTSLEDRMGGEYWRQRMEPLKSGERAIPLGAPFVLGKIEHLGSRHGIEVRHPLYDRRIVEFANAIPDEQRRNGIWQRYVMRQGMSELLPAVVHQRLDKATFDWSFSTAIADEEFGRILESPRIAAVGWIDARRVRTEWEAFRAGRGRYSSQFFTTGAIELWYREMFENQKSDSDGSQACA
jgi:asparagine synthase (glutamine-hydrolysing)